MRDLAEGTGGTFFHDNNDLHAGFERLAAVPEFSYVLGFSPSENQTNGSFHPLKVRLPELKGAAIEARRGYYATAVNAQRLRSSAELEDAIFSQTERNDLPVVLQIGYSKPNHADVAKAYVVARIDVASLHFEKNANPGDHPLNIVVALFDSEGGFVTETAETEHVRLPNATPGKEDPAIALRWEFPGIKAGHYIVRFVIREDTSGATTFVNRKLNVM